MDQLPPDLERLFEEDQALEEISSGNIIRCKCGFAVHVRMPCLCPKCQDPKPYWIDIQNDPHHLTKMDLGHLSNVVRMLARKAEQYPSGTFRADLEIAMDLIYAEIGSRTDELDKNSGILRALQKGL